MRKIFYPYEKQLLPTNILSDAILQKVFALLINHVYAQTNVALFSSVFCAAIVFIGLQSSTNTHLSIWFSFFLAVSLIRLIFLLLYQHEKKTEKRITFWRNIYIVGAALGGISWGLAGILLLPNAAPMQQMLLIMMLAGVTAGAVPLSCSIPQAGITFLVLAILPFIIQIALFSNHIYFLLDCALTLYLIYLLILLDKTYTLIKNSIILKFENDILLGNLSTAKNELEESNKKLADAATHDPLTRLANRRLFEATLTEATKKTDRHKKILALLFLDIDQFKKVNDSYGHHAGDQVLITIIERLANFFNTDKNMARLGGDEFTIILENINDQHEIAAIARKICAMITIPINIHNQNIVVSASIGISIYPTDTNNIETLIRYADKSMYYVKKHGGNNFHFSSENLELWNHI